MNRVITTHVTYRGSYVPVESLRDQSQIEVEVECVHGRRKVRWCRRTQLCKECAIEVGAFNSCRKGRIITWGDKISKAKRGVKATKEHKKALTDARKQKLASRLNKNVDEVEFPTKGIQYKLRCLMMGAINKKITLHSCEEQDGMFKKKLNYTVDELKQHLESKFEPWMTWDNYGEWEIDHIRPESWFSYASTDDAAFKECWALSNLQPMKADQNRKKNNLYEGAYKEKHIYMLCGQSGVGKTSLLKKFTNKFQVLSKDSMGYKELDKFIANNWHGKKPIILDISVHISTTIKRYISKGFKVTPVFLVESIEVVKQNIAARGGRTGNVEQRYNRIRTIAILFPGVIGDASRIEAYLGEI